MPDLTPADIDRLLELEALATPAPWRGGHRCDNAIRAKVGGTRASIGEMFCVHDAALTAAARNLARPLAEQARRVPEMEAEIARMRSALRRLANEVAGVWSAFEIGLRLEISNTNYAAVAGKLREAEAALAQKEERS